MPESVVNQQVTAAAPDTLAQAGAGPAADCIAQAPVAAVAPPAAPPALRLDCALPEVVGAADAVVASTRLIAAAAAGRVAVTDALYFQKMLTAHARLTRAAEARPAESRAAARAGVAAAPAAAPADPAESAQQQARQAEIDAAMDDPDVRLFVLKAPAAMDTAQQRDFLQDLGLELRPRDKVICAGTARAPGLWDIYPPLALTPEPRRFTVALPPQDRLDDTPDFLATLGIRLGPDDRIERGPVPTRDMLLAAASPPLRETVRDQLLQRGAGRGEDGSEPLAGRNALPGEIELRHLGGDDHAVRHQAQEIGNRELAGAGDHSVVQRFLHVGGGNPRRAVAQLHIADQPGIEPRQVGRPVSGAHHMQQIDQQRDIAQLADETSRLVERAEAAARIFQRQAQPGGADPLGEAGKLVGAAGAVGIERDTIEPADAELGIEIDDRLQQGGVAPRLDHQPFAERDGDALIGQHGAEFAAQRPVVQQRPGGIVQRIVAELAGQDGNVAAADAGRQPREIDRRGADLAEKFQPDAVAGPFVHPDLLAPRPPDREGPRR